MSRYKRLQAFDELNNEVGNNKILPKKTYLFINNLLNFVYFAIIDCLQKS